VVDFALIVVSGGVVVDFEVVFSVAFEGKIEAVPFSSAVAHKMLQAVKISSRAVDFPGDIFPKN